MTDENITPQIGRKRGQKISASEIDKLIGMRIRIARNMAGKKQDDLAHYLGLTLQQTQKYENGKNKISVNILIQISKYFQIPISYFIPLQNANSQEQTIHTFNQIDTMAQQVAENWQPIGSNDNIVTKHDLPTIINEIFRHELEDEACKILHELINTKK